MPIGKISPYFISGFTLSIKTANWFSPENSAAIGKYWFVNSFKSPQFGLMAGLGSEIDISTFTSLIFEARYSVDLTSSYNSPSFRLGIDIYPDYFSDNVHNQVFEFQAGLKFSLF